MSSPSTPNSEGPEEESLATPVGGNALNADGNATHNPDKLGAGETGAEGTGVEETGVEETGVEGKDAAGNVAAGHDAAAASEHSDHGEQ